MDPADMIVQQVWRGVEGPLRHACQLPCKHRLGEARLEWRVLDEFQSSALPHEPPPPPLPPALTATPLSAASQPPPPSSTPFPPQAAELHCRMVNEFKGAPGVVPQRLQEGLKVRYKGAGGVREGQRERRDSGASQRGLLNAIAHALPSHAVGYMLWAADCQQSQQIARLLMLLLCCCCFA